MWRVCLDDDDQWWWRIFIYIYIFMDRYPVLIAIDDYNALYDYSAFEYRNQPYVFLIIAFLHHCIIASLLVFMLVNCIWLLSSVVLMRLIILLPKIALMNLPVFIPHVNQWVRSQRSKWREMDVCVRLRIHCEMDWWLLLWKSDMIIWYVLFSLSSSSSSSSSSS